EEAEAAAKARLAEIRRKKEEKKREAEERKRKEELERWKAEEEAKAAEAAKKAAEKAKREEEKRKIEKKKKENQVQSPVSEGSTVVAGKKRKRVVMVAVPSGDPEGDDPNPGDDGDYHESDNEDDDPPSRYIDIAVYEIESI
ncbi:hypothetical protein GGU11DRAFT_761165, partial [Lentinula aff. detonsa]